ncbi:MAG: [FeFe] hydrogenase H-cluster radical SAM maturase HydG [Bacteroidales bacterium]|nr:[FeFe] hydrogenase H-cluster radical SAM maturase HydG [Bacteroidales bacterium]
MKYIDFIDTEKIENLVKNTHEDRERVEEILAKSLNKEALNLEETAALIAVKSEDLLEEIFNTARTLKKQIYGNRIVLFAPLYVGNYCINDCRYCGFRKSAKTTVRKTLTEQELKNEIISLENQGHKRLILVYGESPIYSPEYIAQTVRTCYETKSGNGEIRRVNINAAPLDIEGYKVVKAAGIGTFQVFQETYHRETYAAMHPSGTMKGDYMWRLSAMDRAFEGGIDDMGIGALFGLYDWRFEVLGLVSHAIHLKETFGVGPHTISFPRMQPANDIDIPLPWKVSDDDFKKLVAILRLAVPYTGLIMTARENKGIRDALMQFGVSQIDAGTHLEIGGYSEQKEKGSQTLSKEQFQVGDTRSLDEVICELLRNDFIPSFCTSCYRMGRTGEHFMEFAIPGFIGNFCSPNAILTLAEYLEDYAGEETRKAGFEQIDRELARISDPVRKAAVIKRLESVKEGKRDLHF